MGINQSRNQSVRAETLEDTLKTLKKVGNSTKLFADIEHYLINSHGETHCRFKMRIRNIYILNETGRKPKRNWLSEENRLLLWHGTVESNVQSIIQNGLQIPSNTEDLMFGKGIYFADRSSKSAQYCGGTQSLRRGFLFLCDVDIGSPCETMAPLHDITSPPDDCDSVMGIGAHKFIEEPAHIRYHNGSKMLAYKSAIPESGFLRIVDAFVRVLTGFHLFYNEYVVYDTDKVELNFLVEVEFFDCTNNWVRSVQLQGNHGRCRRH